LDLSGKSSFKKDIYSCQSVIKIQSFFFCFMPQSVSPENLILYLQQRLRQSLPGIVAHERMRVIFRSQHNLPSPNERTRQSAVLLLLYPAENQWFFPLILRPTYDGVHSGQVGFPGGKQEIYDKDLTDTALREANEEIGILREEVEILGNLTPFYVNASNMYLTPVVGLSRQKPDFQPDDREVAVLLQVPLSELLDPQNRKEKEISLPPDIVLQTPYFDLQNQTVWGATALILSEFLEVI
jgi:8-oxo-dGTP pyrophosphatase MutT (NUDIX family)